VFRVTLPQPERPPAVVPEEEPDAAGAPGQEPS
jgi:hypothetical protein